MTSELRDAVEVWRDASDAATLGSVKYKPAADQAAAAVIKADREAVRAEQAAELAKYKALAETLAGVLDRIYMEDRRIVERWRQSAVTGDSHLDERIVLGRYAEIAAEALRQYKETRDD